MIADGIHPNLHRREYDRVERVNFSTLKWMARSPAHYRSVLTTPPVDTDAKKLGRVAHLAAFEPERFNGAIAVWDGGRRYGKDWDKFCEQHEGKELLTLNEYEKCRSIQRAVQANADAMRYVSGGRGEMAVLWTHVAGEGANRYTFEAKGRLDFVGTEAICDLKTTKDASPTGFARQVVGLNYDAQASWYRDGFERATGERRPYVIVAVENYEPFVVQVYRVPEAVLAIGRAKYSAWLDRLAWCREHSSWPGYSDVGPLDLELPAWALPSGDVAALDLEFDNNATAQEG